MASLVKIPRRKSKKRGRPSKWRPEFVEMARAGRRCNCTIDELARSFGVSKSTIHDWKSEYPDFLDAINESRVKADSEVECRLHDLCVGFYYEEETIVNNEIKRIKKYHPPNATIVKFWKINRSRIASELQLDIFSEKIKHEVTGEDGGPIKVETDYTQISDEMAREMIEEARNLKETEDKGQKTE